MKKKYLFLFLIIILVSFVLGYSLIKIEKDNIVTISKNDNKLNSNIAIMYEEDGDYKSSTDGLWPDGYFLNPEKSNCKSNTTIGYDTNADKIIFKGNHPDRCNIYFDKEITLANYIKSIFVYDGYNNIYYHDGKGDYINSDLEAGDNSYRYTGSYEEVNNYVCFGSNFEKCPDENLYRIIGIFDDNEMGSYQVKLIKADYADEIWLGTQTGETSGTYYSIPYGDDIHNNDQEKDDFHHRYKGKLITVPRYKWQKNGDANTLADWPTALLNTVHLNNNFYEKFDDKYKNAIDNHYWYYKGDYWENIPRGKNAKSVYEKEMSNSITSQNYIGLMYVSDYLYAATPDNWNKVVFNDSNSGYVSNGIDSNGYPQGYYSNDKEDIPDYRTSIDKNWMYLGLYEWTITTQAQDDNDVRAYTIYPFGTIQGGFKVGETNNVVRPTFYLKKDVKYVSGDGSIDNPFIID